MNSAAADTAAQRWTSVDMQKRVKRRYAAERRFKALGFGAVALSLAFLAFLLITMATKGLGGFVQTEARLTINFAQSDLFLDPATLAGPTARTELRNADLDGVVRKAALRAYGPLGQDMFSAGAGDRVADAILADPDLVTQSADLWLPVSSKVDIAAKSGEGTPEALAAVRAIKQKNGLGRGFNWGFLKASDSTDPSSVGVWGALKGSFLTILVTMALAFPIGVLSALYLEEFAPRNRWTDAIEVSINNLAAVPSIIFGLLGLAVFLNVMNLPRSAPLVGGLTLALMTMPVIVIAGRNAIKSVPPSIRDAALGVGASRMQVVFHHVLPLALPGILTGTIIGMARALGETAPLLMVGMRAFIAAPPGGVTSPATVLPVQIFLWSDEVDRGFVEKTSAAIIVLLLFMLLMNGLAIYLRNRFERRW